MVVLNPYMPLRQGIEVFCEFSLLLTSTENIGKLYCTLQQFALLQDDWKRSKLIDQ